MPKHDFFSPKAIANRQKARGLQKLRWYCQMCQKQCRDENGFRLHIDSESHQRQLLLFAGQSGRYLNSFSTEFLHGFVSLLSRRYGTKKVLANQVYQEYISTKDHLHMNATCWSTLGGFVRYLGRKGICVVEEGERGWIIQWVDNSLKTLAQKEAALKAERLKKDQEERDRLLIQEQIQRGQQLLSSQATSSAADEKKEFVRQNASKISFKPVLLAKGKLKATAKKPSSVFQDSEDTATTMTTSSLKRPLDRSDPDLDSKKPRSDHTPPITDSNINDDDDMDEEPWVMPGIVVKILNDKLAHGQFYNRKATITSLVSPYIAQLQVTLPDHTPSLLLIRLDQAHLETVIPQVGHQVMLLRGVFRGQTGTLVDVDVEHACATIRLEDDEDGDVISGVAYDAFSKLALTADRNVGPSTGHGSKSD